MKLCFPLFAILASVSGLAQQTDVQYMGLGGHISRLTEKRFTCPNMTWVRQSSCILRGYPPAKYRTVHTKHINNAQGLQTECDHYNSDNALISKNYFYYNSNGYKTQEVTKGSDGTLLGRVVYIYDGNNYLTTISYYNAKDSLYNTLHSAMLSFEYKYLFEYSPEGKILRELRFPHIETDSIMLEAWQIGPVKLPEQTEYDDRKNQPIAILRDTSGALKCVVKRSYTCDKDSSITSEKIYRYEDFDTRGNWHKATTWIADDEDDGTRAAVTVVTRDIDYYE